MSDNFIIACNPQAIEIEHRETHTALAQEIFSAKSVLEVKELDNGYAFKLPLSLLQKTMDFTVNERQCCPFFTFTLTIGDDFWFALTGNREVKSYIKDNLLPAIETGEFPSVEALEAAYQAKTQA